MRRKLARATAVLLLAFGLSGLSGLPGAPAAISARRDDPAKEREKVRARQAAVASKLDVQKASLGKIDTALQALNANLSTQQSLLVQANRELGDARRAAERAALAVMRTQAYLSGLRAKMRERAVAAYMSPPSDQAIDMLRMKSFKAANYRRMYGEVQAANDADLSDQLKGATADLEFARRQAADARRVAESKQADQQARTEKVSAARTRQQAFASDLKQRIDSSVAEAVRLSRTDKALSTRIALEQAALAARLAAARAAAAAAAQAASERAAAAAAARAAAAAAARHNTIRPNGSERAALPPVQPVKSRSKSSGSSGRSRGSRRGTSAPQQASSRTSAPQQASSRTSAPQQASSRTSAPQQASGRSSALPPVSGGSTYSGSSGISLATVNGITVSTSIAGRLQAMINAARGAGLNLTGGGYRDPAQQVSLRRAHCGSSYYAIYQMSASACRPATAPPGQSMHEVGLAVDFASCGSRSTACFQWLSANASRFGFFNLPSEPWHWSVNGN